MAGEPKAMETVLRASRSLEFFIHRLADNTKEYPDVETCGVPSVVGLLFRIGNTDGCRIGGNLILLSKRGRKDDSNHSSHPFKKVGSIEDASVIVERFNFPLKSIIR